MNDGTNRAQVSQKETKVAKDVWDHFQNEKLRQDNSHYRGIGRWSDDNKWQAIGIKTLASINGMLRFYEQDVSYWSRSRNILEWGQGGGANAFAFRNLAQSYYGVDISTKNLAECERMLKAEKSGVFRPVLVEKQVDEVIAKVKDPIDIFISTAVFQHFPSKEYGKEVLATMFKIMAPLSVGVIQIRFDNGNEKFKPLTSLDHYKEKHITATSYALDEFSTILGDVGFKKVFVQDIWPSVNYATFCFKKG